MIEVKSPQQVRESLGIKFPTGKPAGIFPEQRQVVTHEDGKMDGLVLGSALTTQQKYTEKVEGIEHKQDVLDSPEFYKNEP